MPNDVAPPPTKRLKIVVIGNGTHDCAELNCILALRGMGHDVSYFDPEEHPRLLGKIRASHQSKRIVNRLLQLGEFSNLYERAMIETVVERAPDLVLVIPLAAVGVKALAEMKQRTRAKIAGWYQDHVVNFGVHEFLAAEYDALFFKDPYIVDRLRDYAGLAHIHLLIEACEPSVHHSLPLTPDDQREYGCELMIYGSLYAYRLLMLEHLAEFDLRIYGFPPSPQVKNRLVGRADGRLVHRDEKIKAVLASKIVINGCHFGEVRSANARLFEVAGIGGFQVTDGPGVADCFEPGVEVATFKGPKELREVVAHYLARPEERAAMAARAQQRAHRDHTYAKRLQRIIDTVGLGTPA